MFGFINVASVVYLTLFMKETKGLSDVELKNLYRREDTSIEDMPIKDLNTTED